MQVLSIQTVLTLLISATADVKFFEFMKIYISLTNFYPKPVIIKQHVAYKCLHVCTFAQLIKS